MADGRDAGGVQGEVRARVNGRFLTFESDSGKVLKGPKPMLGKFVAGNQLERIRTSDGYYGHLFLADQPSERRLKEAEFSLMESKREDGRLTLIEGVAINFNGLPHRVKELGEKTVLLESGNVVRKYSRERVEREGNIDYSDGGPFEPEDTYASMFSGAPDLIDPISGQQVREAQQYEGSVEVDVDDLADKVTAKILEGGLADTLVERITAKLVEAMSTTSTATGEQQVRLETAE